MADVDDDEAELAAALAMSIDEAQGTAELAAPTTLADDEAELAESTEVAMETEPPADPIDVLAADPMAAGGPRVRFRVAHGKHIHEVDVPCCITVKDFQLHLSEISDVPLENQKLMFKGGLKDTSKTLAEIGVKDKQKIMMVGNKVENIKKLKTAPTGITAATEPEAQGASKTPLCQEVKHKKVIDRGKPADAETGTAGTHSELPESLKGMVNSQSQKIRLVFKMADGQVEFCTPDRTQKFPLGRFPEVTDDPSKDLNACVHARA
jgi:hypothetical protein